jgi:hypothetical protein
MDRIIIVYAIDCNRAMQQAIGIRFSVETRLGNLEYSPIAIGRGLSVAANESTALDEAKWQGQDVKPAGINSDFLRSHVLIFE